MRCLALAESLIELGFRCIFISAALPGNLNSFIRESGFECIEINIIENWTPKRDGSSTEAQEKDAKCFLEKCNHLNIFLIIVDHYSFDKPWENMVFCSKHINLKKSNKNLKDLDLKLIKKPRKPKSIPVCNLIKLS